MSLLGGIGSALGGLFKDTPGGMSASDKLTLIGSALSDFGNGGSPEMTLQARKLISGQQDERQKRAAMAHLADVVSGMMGRQGQAAAPPQMQGPGMDGEPVSPPRPADATGGLPTTAAATSALLPMFFDPDTASVAPGVLSAIREAQPPKPPEDRYIEGRDGIYRIGPNGPPQMVQTYPEKPDTSPGKVNPITHRWDWAPGYLESQGALSGVRRDAVVSRPMPQRARAHAAGGASWLPAGAKIIHMPGQ